MEGDEAMAVVSLLQFAETLQISLKVAIKEDADWYRRFMPLTEVVNILSPFRFLKSINFYNIFERF